MNYLAAFVSGCSKCVIPWDCVVVTHKHITADGSERDDSLMHWVIKMPNVESDSMTEGTGGSKEIRPCSNASADTHMRLYIYLFILIYLNVNRKMLLTSLTINHKSLNLRVLTGIRHTDTHKILQPVLWTTKHHQTFPSHIQTVMLLSYCSACN